MVSIGTIAKVVFLVGGGYILYRVIEGFARGGGFIAPGRIGLAVGQVGTQLAETVEVIPRAVKSFRESLLGLFSSTGTAEAGCYSRPAFQPCPPGTFEKTDALGFGICCPGTNPRPECYSRPTFESCPAGTVEQTDTFGFGICCPTTTTTTTDDDRDGGRPLCGGVPLPIGCTCVIETVEPGIQVQKVKCGYPGVSSAYGGKLQELVLGGAAPYGGKSQAPDDRIGARVEPVRQPELLAVRPAQILREGIVPAGPAEILRLAAAAEAGTPIYTPGNFRPGYIIPEGPFIQPVTQEYRSISDLREAQDRAGFRNIYA